MFKAKHAMAIYAALGIRKEQIDKRQAWQSYIESNFNVQRRRADWHFARATSWEEILAVHDRWLEDFNTQIHWPNQEREDGRRSPAEVLARHIGTQYTAEELQRIFYTTRSTRRMDRLGYIFASSRHRTAPLSSRSGSSSRMSGCWRSRFQRMPLGPPVGNVRTYVPSHNPGSRMLDLVQTFTLER